jgi:hypothetical protein
MYIKYKHYFLYFTYTRLPEMIFHFILKFNRITYFLKNAILHTSYKKCHFGSVFWYASLNFEKKIKASPVMDLLILPDGSTYTLYD